MLESTVHTHFLKSARGRTDIPMPKNGVFMLMGIASAENMLQPQAKLPSTCCASTLSNVFLSDPGTARTIESP